ncbi:hypothetical protein BDW42DRAFT_162327 [Aspergillus taichungensis]|uniref:Uncharacterized protein n=1 Tax=Aspergillus taichungensis TaxID=482145 RepID=A0A2J5I3Y4_9EURO|nr:hypothetical protein BDW42DRAFT_162327 [Aspergillus taichungensis]
MLLPFVIGSSLAHLTLSPSLDYNVVHLHSNHITRLGYSPLSLLSLRRDLILESSSALLSSLPHLLPPFSVATCIHLDIPTDLAT